MLEYAFMQRALLAGVVLGIALPLIGTIVVTRRLSMIGDALSHASLAGVAAGLIAGVNPVAGATIAALVAASFIEIIRRRFADRAELAIALVMSAGVGLAGVLSGFVPNGASFSSFLFGSIVTVSDIEVAWVLAVGVGTILVCLALSRQLFLLAADERVARLLGVRVKVLSGLFTLVCALAISISARTVGSLVVSAAIVVPVAAALQVAHSWRGLVIQSCAIGAASSVIGLTASFYLGTKPGGSIVLVALALLGACICFGKARGYLARRVPGGHRHGD